MYQIISFEKTQSLRDQKEGKRARSKSWVGFLHVLVLPKTKKRRNNQRELSGEHGGVWKGLQDLVGRGRRSSVLFFIFFIFKFI